MTLQEAYSSFRRRPRADREALFSESATACIAADPWALSCTWMAAVVGALDAARSDTDLDDAVREYCRRKVAGDLPGKEPEIALLRQIVAELESHPRFLPSPN